MRTLKWLSIGLGSLALLAIVITGSWSLTESLVQATSDEEFCAICHTMRPFAETHAQDIHGGNNPRGLSAACADCHLPHDSPSRYLFAKAETGVRDIWAELIAIFSEPDWIAKLEQRESYVYDSGCLKCHTHLDQAPDQSPTALFGHQTYFKSEGAMHCVTCHTQVGHKDLLTRLAPPAGQTESDAMGTSGVQESSQ